MILTESVRDFARVIACRRDAGFALGAIDFDGLSGHLAERGMQAVEQAVGLRYQGLALALPDDIICYRGSTDEAVLLAPGRSAVSLVAGLRCVAPGDDLDPLSFTAAAAYQTGRPSLTNLRALDAANRSLIEQLKCHGRGCVGLAGQPPARRSAAEVSEKLAGFAWQRCLSHEGPTLDSITEMEAALRECETAILAVPVFGGRLLEPYQGGGVTELPDGERAGKLGFLNGIFGDHLVSNLVIEPILSEIAHAVPHRAASRLSSGLIAALDTACDVATLERSFEEIALAFDSCFAPALRIAAFRTAILEPPAAGRFVLDLAQHLFRVEGLNYVRSGRLALHDLRGLPDSAFRSRLDLQSARALRRATERAARA